MKKVSIILWGLAALLVTAAVGVILVIQFVLPRGEDPGQRVPHAVVKQGVTATVLQPSAHDKLYALNSSNVTISFTAAKSIAGRVVNVSGGWSGKFGSRLTGSALIDTNSEELRQARFEIEVGSLWSEHEMLTRNLKTCGFFNLRERPTATFLTTRITRCEPATNGLTHLVEGNFVLNGIEKSLTAPVNLKVTADGFKLESRFVIDRRDFGVLFRDNSAFPMLNDDNILPSVALNITVECGAVPPAGVSHSEGPVPAGTALAASPGERPKSFREVIPFSQVPFEMVLVPGDSSRGIRAFYLGRTEVTWDEFMPWAACKDIEEETRQAEQRALQQRPSVPYSTVDRGFGLVHRPALSMSRLSAGLYCQWLSRQTGRHYRLLTEKEWEYAYELGGSRLSQPLPADEANSMAVWQGNSYSTNLSRNMTLPVGSKAPNQLGIYDMAGNVSEWVTDTGTNNVVRGGSFLSPLEALGGLGRDQQDDDVWNANYPGMPGDPKSLWWFTDAHGVGFRLACDPP